MRLLLAALAALLGAAAAEHVAIVGGGMAGATTAMFLRDGARDKPLDITVFEKLERFGGRLFHQEIEGKTIEIGGTLIYDGNRYVCDLATRVGARMVPPINGDNLLGIWDGSDMVFEQSAWGAPVSLAKMLWRWGYSDLQTLDAFVGDMLARFNRVYELQAAGRAFERPEDLWRALGLFELTQRSFADFLAEQFGRADAPLARELLTAINRVNYNQGNELNALAGAISMCPLVTGDVVVSDVGNDEVARRLVEASGARVRLRTRVADVARDPADGRYWLNGGEFGPFDAVVVASPLEFAPIAFEGMPPGSERPRPARAFQKTHSTWIKGRVDPAYFGGRAAAVPGAVLMAADSREPFSSLASYLTYPDGDELHKLFSPEALPDALLDRLFRAGWTRVFHAPWDAYPRFAPPEQFASFRLFDGERVYYPSALETGAAAMEISAVAGKNAALMVLGDLGWAVGGGSGADGEL